MPRAATNRITLRTEFITAAVCPDEGGRVASLRWAATGAEFLTQSQPKPRPLTHGLQARFEDGPCAGIEDCLPTVGACGAETEGGAVPDHGDLWQRRWTVVDATGAAIVMETACFSRPLTVRKRISVAGRVLRMDYEVRNTGAAATSLLFALHPLLAVTAGDRIILPAAARHLRLTYLTGDTLPTPANIVWPEIAHRGGALDLSIAGAASDDFAAMLYSDRLERGLCGLYRSQWRQGLLLRFDTAALPYLGVWLCYGGWPSERGQPRQYAVALEPTTAPCNTLLEAQRAGSASHLQPGGRMAFQLEIELTSPGLSYAEFLAQAGHDDAR